MRLSLRAQIALAAGLVALVIVALAGATIALRMDHRDRTAVDTQLAARAERVTDDVGKLLDNRGGDQGPDDGYGDLLDGSESLVLLLDGDTVVAQRGAVPDQPPPIPETNGYATFAVDGTPWRSYVVTVSENVRLQVLQSLEPVNERRDFNTRLIVLVTLLAAVAAGAAGWFVGRRVLRPLDRLAMGATEIAHDPDPQHRLPAVDRPTEIAALSSTLNGMLDRLGEVTEATRRFTADVGHELRGPLTASGSYLETLLATPDLAAEVREPLIAVHHQHERLVATLNALQLLARGDVHALAAPVEFEPGVLVDELVRLARHRHPTVSYTCVDTSRGTTVHGWPDGLRIAVDNLLDNAALHGRPNGQVHVSVRADDRAVFVRVDDDGPGIPEDQRDVLRRRFSRGSHTVSRGSGLGLALVEQQAELHQGSLELETSPIGGLRAALRIPAG